MYHSHVPAYRHTEEQRSCLVLATLCACPKASGDQCDVSSGLGM